MKQEDLSEIKHVGLTRMRLLNDSGIINIKQLHEMSLEKLSDIKWIGEHSAKMIKNSVSEYYREKHEKLPGKTASDKEKKNQKINRDLQKRIKRLHKNLNRVNENLKPLWEKKYLELYIDFKKKFKRLKARLSALGRIKEDLPKKDRKNIIKKADTLIITLKKVGKKPKKKKYKQTTQEIQSFSRLLRDIIS
jgi:uncharacterized FlaG/YvyC family protein